VPRRLAASSCRGHVDESATGLCLVAALQAWIGTATDGTEAAAIDLNSFRRQLKKFMFQSAYKEYIFLYFSTKLNADGFDIAVLVSCYRIINLSSI